MLPSLFKVATVNHFLTVSVCRINIWYFPLQIAQCLPYSSSLSCADPLRQSITWSMQVSDELSVSSFWMPFYYESPLCRRLLFILYEWKQRKAQQSYTERKTEHLLIIDQEENSLVDPAGTKIRLLITLVSNDDDIFLIGGSTPMFLLKSIVRAFI